MSKLAQWAEADDAPEDDNLLWDDAADKKLGENHEGIHLRRQEPSLNVVVPPPAPVVKRSARKATKFSLGERALASPSAPTQKMKYRAISKRNAPKGTNNANVLTSARLSTSSVSSTGSTGTSMAQLIKNAETPEQIRRFLLAEVKQMTIERLVVDAKRFAFLESFYASHQEPAMHG